MLEKGLELLFGGLDKRSVDWDNTSIMFHWNTTNLRGRDVDMLHGLTMNITDANTAVFKTEQFEVKGNVSKYIRYVSYPPISRCDKTFGS